MPWDEDQFEYTHGYINIAISCYFPLLEMAKRNPSSNAAAVCYDLSRIFTQIRLTPKQGEAFLLRLHGYTYQEIADELGIWKYAAYKRLHQTEKKINDFLCRG